RGVILKCASLPPKPDGKIIGARLDSDWLDRHIPVEITVNTNGNFFFNLSDYTQSSTLWHEMLHNYFGPHHPGTQEFDRFGELDPVEACQNLCFGPEPVTKCSCARCLRTNKCDDRCKLYVDCDEELAFVCPCPTGKNAFKYFPTCRDCLATCPSG